MPKVNSCGAQIERRHLRSSRGNRPSTTRTRRARPARADDRRPRRVLRHLLFVQAREARVGCTWCRAFRRARRVAELAEQHGFAAARLRAARRGTARRRWSSAAAREVAVHGVSVHRRKGPRTRDVDGRMFRSRSRSSPWMPPVTGSPMLRCRSRVSRCSTRAASLGEAGSRTLLKTRCRDPRQDRRMPAQRGAGLARERSLRGEQERIRVEVAAPYRRLAAVR